jgi:hypothetical protein
MGKTRNYLPTPHRVNFASFSSARMTAELVDEFPEGHKEAAEHHKDRGDPPDRTEPLLLEMGQKKRPRHDLRKADGEADDIKAGRHGCMQT